MAACIAIALTFSSCGNDAQNTQNNDDLKSADISSDTTTSTSDVFYIPPSPLDEFNGTDEENLVISIGKWSYVKSCMQKQGFDYKATKPTLDSNRQKTDFDEYWGILTITRAEKRGYNDKILSDKITNENGMVVFDDDGNPMSIPANETEYYNEQSKCNSEFTQKKMDAGGLISESSNSKFHEITEDSSDAALSDNQITSIITKWSECMKKAGYDYDTPKDALNTGWDTNVTDKEKQTAEQDVKCKQETKLMDTWYSVLYEKQKSLIDKYRPVLEERKQQTQKWLEFAQKIISENAN